MADDFRPGALTVRQAQILNELVRTSGQFDRLTVAPPLALSRRAGIPNITADFAVPVLAEITGNNGATPPVHTAKRKTRSAAGVPIDYPTLTTYGNVLNPAQTAIATGALVELVPIPEYPDSYWAFPASGTITSAESPLASPFTLSGAGLDDTGLSVTLPSAGVYFIYGTVTGHLYATFAAGEDAFIIAQINALAVPASTVMVADTAVSAAFATGTAAIGFRYTGAAGEVLRLYAGCGSTGGTAVFSTKVLLANGNTVGGTHLGYLKLA